MAPEAMPALKEQLRSRLEIVHEGIDLFAANLREEMADAEPCAQDAVGAYLTLLERKGKSWRGMLAVTGYTMCQGEDRDVIVRASGAIEGLHTFLLVDDDCADRDAVRRGGPTAHTIITNQLNEQGASGDTAAGGMHLAMTGAKIAQFKALQTFHNLNVPSERKDLVQDITYAELMKTGIGQIIDISGSHLPLSKTAIIQAARYKTARYTFMLPLQLGAALAGASKEEVSYFEPYADNAGLAFQFRDDIIGLFGSPSTTGKSPESDIISNKKTLLMYETLARAGITDRIKVKAALGNVALQPEQFEDCLRVIKTTGALDTIEQQIALHTERALESLAEVPDHWDPEQISFLRNLVIFGAQRQH